MSTPWAPFIAVSCTPLYPFCPRTSQICIAISTSAAGWPRLKLRFETLVPIVVMYSSEYGPQRTAGSGRFPDAAVPEEDDLGLHRLRGHMRPPSLMPLH